MYDCIKPYELSRNIGENLNINILSNINKYNNTELENVLKTKKNNIHIFNVSLLHHDKIRRVFVMFVEKLHDLYFTIK